MRKEIKKIKIKRVIINKLDASSPATAPKIW